MNTHKVRGSSRVSQTLPGVVCQEST